MPVTSIDMVTLGSDVSAWATGIGDTVYHYQRIVTGVEEHPQPLPRHLTLSQNYPNPFNPSTSIRFDVPVSGFVSLRVYDLLGEQVSTLANEERTPGSYVVRWEAAGLPSGIYFYRLSANGYVETKKLILAR